MTDPAILPEGWRSRPVKDREALRQTLRLTKFRRTYRNDWVACAHDLFDWKEGEGPEEYQEWVLTELVRSHRVSERGPHGLGKTSTEAWFIIIFALTRDGEDDWKTVTTAYRDRQLTQYLWPEVHKWIGRIRWGVVGRDPFAEGRELLDTMLKLSTGRAIAASPGDAAAIEGAHADQMAYVYEEAKSIEPDMFDATEGAFAGAGPDTSRDAYALAMSTPGVPSGRFHDIHSRKAGYEDWSVRHVTLDEAIAAGRISAEWVDKRARQWGRTSAVFHNRVLGEFAASEESSVIPLAWVEAAQERWRELAVSDLHSREESIPVEVLPPLTNVGVDIADEGGDQNAMALRYGQVVTDIRRWAMGDVMETTGKIVGVLRKHDGSFAVIDTMPAGPVARVREQGYAVVPFTAGQGSDAVDETGELEFLNLRAEAWWGMRERLAPEGDPNASQVCLPPDDQLVGDLTAPRWKQTSSGKIVIEDKDTIRKRLGRSTDVGDAVVMSFWGRYHPPAISSPVGRKMGRVTS